MASAPIRFTCFACGGNVRAPASQIGETVQCPHCSATVIVPANSGEAAPTAPVEPQPAEGQPAARSRRTEAAVDNTGPLRIEDLGAERNEFTVTCPTCGTRVSATPANIGLAVTCPDCFSPVPILPREAGGVRQSPATRAETDIQLSDPVVTPRYVPQPASGVRPDELYVEPPIVSSSPREDTDTDLQEFTVSCPVCHTRVDARASQIGHNILCPDCETEFTVRAPRKLPKKGIELDNAEDFQLGDVVERPKYEPTTRGTVTRDELDIIKFLEPPPSPPVPNAPPPATAGKIDFFVVCPTCGSKVGARSDQIGQLVRCSDCLTDVLVKAPAAARTTPSNPSPAARREESFAEPQAPPIPTVATPTTPPAATTELAATGRRAMDVMDEASREAIARAEVQADEVEAIIKLDELPPFQQLFSILADPAVLIRLIVLSGLVLIEFTLLKTLMELSGNAQAFAPIIVLVMVGFGVPLLGFGCAAIVAIVEGTAVGQVRITTWAESFVDSLWPMLQVAMALSISSFPGVVLMSIGLSAGLPTLYGLLLPPLSVFLLFPFIFLSILEGDHPFHVISPVVARSIPNCFPAWLRYYGESLVLLVAIWGLQLMIFTDNFFIRTVVAVGLLTCIALYIRSVGLLAYSCNKALMKPVRAEATETAEEESR